MRDEVEELLHDSSNAIWSADEIDRAIRSAFYEFAAVHFRLAEDTISDVDGQREYALSGLTNLHHVVSVWWPYDDSDPDYPPLLAPYQMVDDTHLLLMTEDEPAGDDKLRVLYAARHTLNGLDGASTTTLNGEEEEVVILLSAAYACLQMAVEAVTTINVFDAAPSAWCTLSELFLQRAGLIAGPTGAQGGRTDRGWPLDR